MSTPQDRHTDRLSRMILESATEFAIVTLDREGVITSWSSGAERLMQWTASQTVGQQGRMIFTPEDRAAGSPEHEMGRALRDGRAVDERLHLRADGSRFWGSGLLMPLHDGGEAHEGFLKIMRDRTIEREAERRFTTLTDALPGLVFVTDTDGHNVQVNGGFESYTGRTSAQLLGDRWLEVVRDDDRERAKETWAHAVQTGEVYEAAYHFRRHDGLYRCFSCRGVPERDEEGRVIRWLGTCVDVENQAQAQRALEQLNRNLEHAVTERTSDLQSAVDQLRDQIAERERAEEALRHAQRMEAIGQLTGGVAHDFNNLLTVISSSVDLLRRPQLTEARRARYIDAIAETTDRAAKLTAQLLAFARRQPLKPEVFDAGEQVKGLQTMLRTIVGSSVALQLDLGENLPPVKADASQFETAIVNMAVNARDAMPAGGTLTVAVRRTDRVPATRSHPEVQGDYVALSLSDTGSGMSQETAERIFEPFYTTKDVGKGTGLGLSQVHGFAKQSGGEIVVRTALGQGTTFILYMPRALGDVSSSPRPTKPTPVSDLDGDGCILVVEDNRLVGEFAAQLLEELGFDTRWVMSGDAALELLGDNPERFDAVFSDVVMPGMTGIELAEALRMRAPDLPVVLTSGYSDVLAQEGAHGFELLQKPYSVARLSAALRKVGVRGRTSDPEADA